MIRLLRIFALCCVACALASSQDKAPTNEVFSGNVTELTADSLTVVRKLPALAGVTRRFLRDEKTKVEGPLKVAARVTVRFEMVGDGQFHALHVLVR